jgi:Protein of unknown function (DUF2934)
VNSTYDLPEERIMPTNSYQIAYDRAGSEIAEIGAQLETLTCRKELLARLLEPLSLLVSESDSSAIPAYAIAYEQAVSEIAAIDAQIQNLPRRKALLEQILEPLKNLVSEFGSREESDFAQAAETASNGSYAEFTDATEESADFLAGVPESESGPFENPPPSIDREEKEAGLHAGSNGQSHSIESQTTSSEGRIISLEDVAELAYRFWDERGRLHGHHEEDWRRAAHELQHSAY